MPKPSPTILVTGGAGFIGSNFVRHVLASSALRIINLDKLTYAGNLANLHDLPRPQDHTFVHGDIGDRALVSSILERHQPQAVINFAAESHVDRSIDSAAEFLDTNIAGLFNLLESSRAYWTGLDEQERGAFRFLQVSTDEVYGSLGPDAAPFAETHPYQPNSPYSASKAAGDHLVRAWHHTYGLPTLTTNCSNNYGPFQFPEKLIPLIISNAIGGRKLPIYGDGMQVRDWLYVDDHCSALLAVLGRGNVGQVYNIGGRSELPNIEVVRTICAILDRLRPRQDGKSHDSAIEYVKDRPGHDRRYAIDDSRIATELGWQPASSFRDGIEDTVRWYLANWTWIEEVRSGEYRRWIARQYGEISA